ncbi:MAG: hypothetical protein IPM01_15175 [Burkholderiaceae bacterium]|nr:hypothetical protein [Burkholderiaceae bacterium]
MTKVDLSIDDVRTMAEGIGMTGLSDGQLQELLRATLASRARRTALRTATLSLADEPAHVFSLVDRSPP